MTDIKQQAREILADSAGDDAVAAIIKGNAFPAGLVSIDIALSAIEAALRTTDAGGRDADRIKRDIAEMYDVMPMLPITTETMDSATDWLTRYCLDFHREINVAQQAAIAQREGS